MALIDIEGSLVPVVQKVLNLDTKLSTDFVRLWRTKQMERAASSNSLGNNRTSFRECTAMALDYCLGHHKMMLSPDIHRDLVFAWDTMKAWPEADAAIAAVKEKGYQNAILSNGDQDMLEAVARNFSPKTFDHILSSETAGYYKPHPSVYEIPTTALGKCRGSRGRGVLLLGRWRRRARRRRRRRSRRLSAVRQQRRGRPPVSPDPASCRYCWRLARRF